MNADYFTNKSLLIFIEVQIFHKFKQICICIGTDTQTKIHFKHIKTSSKSCKRKIRIRKVRIIFWMVWARYKNGNPLANPRRQYWRQICLPGQQQAFFCSVLLICTKTDRAFFTFFSRHATTLVTKSGYCITSKTIQYHFIGQRYLIDLL